MRVIFTALIALAVAACAARVALPEGNPSEWPFPNAPRGSAIRPPASGAAAQTAPPEGVTPGGVDFGHWRGADPATYQPSFQAQMRQRLAGKSDAALVADLQANGFACQQGERTQCRIEIMERQCAYDWYVVREPAREEPIAGFDIMCLGANP